MRWKSSQTTEEKRGEASSAQVIPQIYFREALKKLAAVKWNSEDYEKMYKAQVEHFTKTLADLKK